MSDVIGARAPAWLRIVAALGLLWNLYGVYEYLRSVGVVAGADPAMAATAMPTWVVGAFAIAVFAGALGSLGLLLLARWSKWLLGLSLIAVLAQDIWAFALSGIQPAEGMGIAAAIVLVAIVLFWLAYSADNKRWLR
jgi:hypothetical protein